ncbi:2,3-bisphosphoglycerate-independent phosphoglycerate mutase [Methanolinea mesophila]|uniref:2,3-bisphosphoglycerate-independent phosphoglycerate mutase n=1 Tax=Methanolinea mesophila TaxID=547055 RepID=UPI001AE6CF9C|nr:2,3-bisphosphoglycerate-independent phosphoglycerate mutase [Methanolinea mesophila]MBP1929134.1 2,3-bisphosphoglycerate-independent phosphoglycerate mutase [Methanolinea mesophila]
MTAHKILLLVLDGVSDRPCPELAGHTPLQAALTPVLDQIAREGITGIMDTIAPGIRPGSDTAHLALLGYPPRKYYTGRGPLEALGNGIRMEPGMIGFRCNYATLDREGKVIDRRAGRIHNTEPLSAAIQERVDLSSLGVGFVFRSGAGHRAALALKGEGLGHCVSSNDPKKEGVPPLEFEEKKDTPGDRKTAEVLNEFVRQSTAILDSHPLNTERMEKGLAPANVILIRGAGEMGHFEPFEQRYGLSGSVIAAATLISGIGISVGLHHVPVSGATGSVDTNLTGKVEATLRELEKRDFVLLNIKGADEAGHDGKAVEKRDFIEKVDLALAPFLELEDCIIAVCADHSTPCSVKDHSADPVPLVIRGEGVRVDNVGSFDELACARGGLHRLSGNSLMPVLLDLINKSHKYGA